MKKKTKKSLLSLGCIISASALLAGSTAAIPAGVISSGITVNAAQVTDGFEYYVTENNEVTITRCLLSQAWKVTVPSEIDGKTVTSIGNGAFEGCNLEIVIFPDSVTSIGDGAFYECRSLTSVTIPDNVTSIGDEAFKGCYRLADSNGFVVVNGILFDHFGEDSEITIPNGVTSIGDYAFGYFFDFDTYENVKIEGFAIDGVYGSEAEKYANDNGFEFIGSEPEYKLGDVNGDEFTDIADALMIARFDAGLAELTEVQQKTADVNKDNFADIADALMIARFDAGLIDSI